MSITTLPASPIIFRTLFEETAAVAGAKTGGWTQFPGVIGPTTSRSRSGSKSIKCLFRYADWTTSIHCQILSNVAAVLGTPRWHGFSTFMDSDYTPDLIDNHDITWQMHGNATGPGGLGAPPVGLYIYGDTQRVHIHGDSSGAFYASGTNPVPVVATTFPLADDVGVWIDWVTCVNYKYTTDGRVEIWKKKSTDSVWTKIVDYTGSTLYHSTGESTQNGPDLEIGPYKWDWQNTATQVATRTMFIDEVRIGDGTAVFNDVVPGQ